MICIQLNQSSLDCLRDHASDALPQLFQLRGKESGYVELKRDSAGWMPGKQIQLCCANEEAEQLLAIAQKECKGAVPDIKEGLRLGDKDI